MRNDISLKEANMNKNTEILYNQGIQRILLMRKQHTGYYYNFVYCIRKIYNIKLNAINVQDMMELAKAKELSVYICD